MEYILISQRGNSVRPHKQIISRLYPHEYKILKFTEGGDDMDKTNMLIVVLVVALVIIINMYIPDNPLNKLVSSVKGKLFKKT
jgi:hypothetical protein